MQKPHKNLEAWRKGMKLVQTVYVVTRSFPAAERFGLSGQIRRAAVSIVANLAEGAARQNPREFSRFIQIAAGSASELDTLLEVSARVGLLNQQAWEMVDIRLAEVVRLLFGLRRWLHHQLPSKS